MDPYQVQTNPDCKFFGVDSERCPAGSSLEEDHSLLLGLPLYVGGSMNLTDSVYLSITSSFHIFRGSLLENAAFNSLLQNEPASGIASIRARVSEDASILSVALPRPVC